MIVELTKGNFMGEIREFYSLDGSGEEEGKEEGVGRVKAPHFYKFPGLRPLVIMIRVVVQM
jgi:hypothetical protein